MIGKYLVATLISTVSLLALTDLGLHGKTKSIEGESFIDELEKRYEKVDKKKLVKDVLEARKEALKIDNNMPTCSESRVKEFVPIIKMNHDIKVPIDGTVLYKKDTSYNILKEQNINFGYHIMFINSDDEIQMALAQQLSNKSYIMIAQGDVRGLVNDGENIQIARKNIELKMFKVKCLPTILTQKGNKFIVNEYNPQDLVAKE